MWNRSEGWAEVLLKVWREVVKCSIEIEMKKYDIFISYRHEGGYDTAKHLSDLLIRDGYRVSFDIDTLRSGDFDTQLYERIDLCKDFILIVDQHAFDRTIINTIPREKDWLRCELAYALQKNKNIIPIFLSGVNRFPENLPDDIIDVVKKNGPEYNRYYFDEFYRTLRKRFLHDKRAIWKKILVTIVTGFIVCSTALVIIVLSNGYKFAGTDNAMAKVEEQNIIQSTYKVKTSANNKNGVSLKGNSSQTQKKTDSITIGEVPTTNPTPIERTHNTNKQQKATNKTSTTKTITSNPVSSVPRNQDLRIYGIDELMKLAASGDARAYIPLAKYYYNNASGIPSYERVHQYATKAIKANVDVSEAKKLINDIDALGFYDNSNYTKPNF